MPFHLLSRVDVGFLKISVNDNFIGRGRNSELSQFAIICEYTPAFDIVPLIKKGILELEISKRSLGKKELVWHILLIGICAKGYLENSSSVKKQYIKLFDPTSVNLT